MKPQRMARSLAPAGLAVVAIAWLGPAALAESNAPVIEQIEPTSGPVGTVVNVIGRHFGPDAKVSLGAQPLAIVQSRPNRIAVRIPEAAQSGNIAVTAASGTVRGPEFRVTSALPPPVIDSIEPLQGPPGSHVTIRGQRFSPLLTANVVTLAGQPLVVLAATPRELQVVVPEGTAGGPFEVRVGQAGAATSTQSFTITAATAITAIEPPRAGPGAELKINGHGFSKVPSRNRVYLNNAALEVKSASESQLVVGLPVSAASGKLLVDVQGAGRAFSTEPFVVQRPPRVLDFQPKLGPAGTVIAVRGTNFGDRADGIEAILGDAKLLVREAHDTSLSLEVPEGASSGRLSVRVYGVGPAWSSQQFTVLTAVKLTGFTPRSGAPGSEVTVTGEGFGSSVARVRASIGGKPARVLATTPGSLRLRVPSTHSGPIEIRVAGNGQAQSAEAFEVVEASAAAQPAAERAAGTPKRRAARAAKPDAK